MSRFSLLVQIGILVINLAESAKILAVLPTPSISHQVVFRPLMLQLAKRGHELVVITPDPVFPKNIGPGNLTEIDLHDLSYDLWKELFLTTSKGANHNMYEQIKLIMRVLSLIFEKQLLSTKVQTLLKDKTKNFDLIFIEACSVPALSFSYFYKAPVILISSFGTIFGNEEIIGAPTHPFLYPSITRQRINNLTTWEKVSELYMHYSMRSYFYSQEEEDNKMLKKHLGADFPSLSELKNNVEMIFLNVHPIWQGNHPVPPSVVYMGGMHQHPQKPLPKDLQSFLDSSQNGVIYISFGTNVMPSLLPAEKIHVLVSVMSQLPYDVLWKWDKDILPGQTKNIKISKWFPQSDLLRHPKIKIFVTQGGLQSTDEAITAGVPLIGIPMLGDQWYNCEKYEKHKIGMKLELDTITGKSFKEAIETVITDGSYRRNIKKLRELMLDQPQAPLDRVVWWTEHVLRHGSGRHLRSPAANISWAQYLEIRLALIILLTLLVLCAVLSTIIYYFTNLFSITRKEKLKKL